MKDLWRVMGLATVLAAVQPAMADDVPVWDQAAKTYESAMSQYKQGLVNQAQGLFEEFVRKFPTNESVPYAYLCLADCRARQRNPKGWEDAMDEILKRFPGSPVWFVAASSRLGAAGNQKKCDEYLDLLEAATRVYKELPLDFVGCWMEQPGQTWYRSGRANRWVGFEHMPWAPAQMTPGGERQLLRMCDTPERALRALKILAPTFKRKRNAYAEWQFVHTQLLRHAGKDDEADKAFDSYAQDWGNDPAGLALWLMQADQAAANCDNKTFDATWDAIVTKYAGYVSLGEHLGRRLAYLLQQNRLDDYQAVGDAYLKSYPKGPHVWGIVANRIARLRPAVVKGDAAAEAKVQELIDQYAGKDSAFARQWRIDVLMEANRPQEALKILQPMLMDEGRWGGGTYQGIIAWSARHKDFSVLLQEAKAKYKVVDPDPNGPGGELLKSLQVRIKDEQVRHMEELGHEMLEKYPDSAEAIEACRLLMTYYFNKVLPEPRDRWANEVISRYGQNPAVEGFLVAQVRDLGAASKFAQQGAMLDELRRRFPGGNYGFDWFDVRAGVYGALKDSNGREETIRQKYGPAADQGVMQPLQIIGGLDLAAMKADNKKAGDYWLAKSKKFQGKNAERLLWTWALGAYRQPYPPEGPNQVVCWDDCQKVVRMIQEQTQDPEMRWAYAWSDINLMFEKRDAVAALEALNQRIAKDTTLRQLAGLNWGTVAGILGEAKMVKEAMALADKLDKLEGSHEGAFNWMRATVCMRAGQGAQAAPMYQQLVDDTPWPAAAFDNFMQLYALSGANAPAVAERYIASMPKAQDLVMRVLAKMAENPALKAAMRARLAKEYPASSIRGPLEAPPPKPK